MHTQKTSLLTLRLLWKNYLQLDSVIRGTPVEPYDLNDLPSNDLEKRIAIWVSRQSFFLGAWNLWEQFADDYRVMLPQVVSKLSNESVPVFLTRSFKLNGFPFENSTWFENANGLRNLLVHYGARFRGDERSQKYFKRAQLAFPSMTHSLENYAMVEHDHVAETETNIREFIERRSVPIHPDWNEPPE